MRHPVILAVVLALAAAGCPRRAPSGGLPGVPDGGDPDARARFVEARAEFQAGRGDAGDFAELVEEFPDDPIAPWAQLYVGEAHLRQRAFAEAVKPLLEVVAAPVDAALVRRAELLLGLARAALGEWDKARGHLVRGEAAATSDDDRVAWHAAIAAALAAGDLPLEALAHYDAFWPDATPGERGHVLARVEAIVAAASAEAIAVAWANLPSGPGPVRAILGERRAADLAAEGNAPAAEALRAELEASRLAFGLAIHVTPAVAPVGAADPGLLGALLPSSGKQARLGEQASRALALLAGEVTIELRPTATADEAVPALDALAAAGVIAAIGPIDGPAVDAAAARAEALRLPMLSLAPRPEERAGGAWVFHAMHSAEARAQALAQRALAAGVTKVALLAPDSGYGRAVGEAFTRAIEAGGGKVVDRESYKADAKSFLSVAERLGGSFEAVMVADRADVLELIAPALAAAGLRPQPRGTAAPPTGRGVWLLSTAEGLGADYLVDAGRHSVGALLAPGFYPDAGDPIIDAFSRRFRAEYKAAPTAIEAYAFDAAQAIVAAKASDRSGVAAALRAGVGDGVTGSLRWNEDHRRADGGVVFEVVADAKAPGGAVLRARR